MGVDMMLRAMAEKDGNYYLETGSPAKCAKLVESEDGDRGTRPYAPLDARPLACQRARGSI